MMSQDRPWRPFRSPRTVRWGARVLVGLAWCLSIAFWCLFWRQWANVCRILLETLYAKMAEDDFAGPIELDLELLIEGH